MKLPKGEWDGAVPRSFVLGLLKSHGVEVNPSPDSSDWFELVDADGDSVVSHIPNPILRAQVVWFWRRFGPLHGFKITDLVPRRRKN